MRGINQIIAANHKLVAGWDGEAKGLPIAHHVKGAVAKHGKQADHAQHGGFAQQNVAANLGVVGYLALLAATHRGRDIYGSVEGLDECGVRIEPGNQLIPSGPHQRGGAHAALHGMGAEEAATQRRQAGQQDGKAQYSGHCYFG